MKINLFILCIFFSAVCSAQSRPISDTMKNKMGIGQTWEPDYIIQSDGSFWPKPIKTNNRNVPKLVEMREIDFHWLPDSKSTTETHRSYYVNEDGVTHNIWSMTRNGKTLYLDSTSANRMFQESDTIKVAGKVFVAQRKPVNAIDSIFMYYW